MAVKQPTSGPGFQKPCKKIDVHIHLAKENNGMGFSPEARIAFDKYFGVEKSAAVIVVVLKKNKM